VLKKEQSHLFVCPKQDREATGRSTHNLCDVASDFERASRRAAARLAETSGAGCAITYSRFLDQMCSYLQPSTTVDRRPGARHAAPAVRRPHTPGHGRLKRAAVEALVSNDRKRIFRSAASWPYTFKFVSPVAATAAGIFLSVTLFSCHSLLACYLLDPVSVYRLRYSTALSTAQRSASTCAEHFTLILLHRRP
jgi:hypothetical protein